MEINNLYPVKSGATPEEGVFFYANQRITNELTKAEANQMSMDYEDGPNKFREVVRFRNKYIDEIEFVAYCLAHYRQSAHNQRERDSSYKALLDFMGSNGYDRYHRRGQSEANQTFNVANSAAGSYVMQNEQELRAEHDHLTYAAGGLIELMAGYFKDRALGSRLRINGLDYKLHKTALTCLKKDHGEDRVTFFEKSRLKGPEWWAIGEISSEFMRDNYVYANAASSIVKGKMGPRHKDREIGQKIKIASLDDWQDLIDGLNLMAKY